MKVTLDHCCIIELEKGNTELAARVRGIVESPRTRCFVTDMGASEARRKARLPESYHEFRELLEDAGVTHLKRLSPMLRFDVTYLDCSVWADDETIGLARAIERVLFPNGVNTGQWKSTVNRICDVDTMWCHIWYKNDVFLTEDRNFLTKGDRLRELGAGRVSNVEEVWKEVVR